MLCTLTNYKVKIDTATTIEKSSVFDINFTMAVVVDHNYIKIS